ncbi:hypothetical protein [Nitrospira sp. Kam-Ns4a]
MRRWPALLALAAAGLYLTLALAAAACPLDHTASHGARHQHPAGALQAAFCVWACQVGSTSTVTSNWLPVGRLRILLLLSIGRCAARARLPLGAALSRAPPSLRSA